MATPLELIDRTIEIIESGWTRGTFARSKDGRTVESLDPEAVRWCLLGAQALAVHEMGNVDHLTGPRFLSPTVRVAVAINQEIETAGFGQTSHAAFNDGEERTQEQVLGVLRAARKNLATRAAERRRWNARLAADRAAAFEFMSGKWGDTLPPDNLTASIR